MTCALGPSHGVLVLIASHCLYSVLFLSVAKCAFALLLKQRSVFYSSQALVSYIGLREELKKRKIVPVCSLLETV